ncbi:MAG TPA: acetamidase/formamidase family protein [Candidatus Methylomirabilis sp.]
MTRRLSRERKNIHNRWNRDLPPVLTVDSGDTVVFETRDAGDDQVERGWTGADFPRLDRGRTHALTGPVAVRGVEPGDALQVDILDVQVQDWGYQMVAPGLGFLPEDFPDPHIAPYAIDLPRREVMFAPHVRLPLRPHPGILGVAPAEPGEIRTLAPGVFAGNVDIRELTPGATLYIPVFVPGALFSTGDVHATMGDGEVCLTGVETRAEVTLGLTVRKDLRIAQPHYETAVEYGIVGHGPTLEAAAKHALRGMIDCLAGRLRLSRVQAYCLCSAAVDLRINQVVNAGVMGVRAVVSKALLARGA